MKNIDKYRFKDFTISNYQKIIETAKRNEFQFSFFYNPFSSGQKHLLWRHDVEFSPFIAEKMAEIEAKERVKATYFFQLHGEFYNVLEKKISEIVYKIKSLGHDIGLHFDSHYFGVTNEADLEKYLSLDTQYFNSIFRTDIKVFSFHNTNRFILSCEKKKYAGLINVYSRFFKNHFNYCADSTGYWRYERLADVLNNSNILKLQVLTHDAMWSDEILAPRQRVFKSVDANAIRVKRWYDKTLLKFRATNVDIDKVNE